MRIAKYKLLYANCELQMRITNCQIAYCQHLHSLLCNVTFMLLYKHIQITSTLIESNPREYDKFIHININFTANNSMKLFQ